MFYVIIHEETKNISLAAEERSIILPIILISRGIAINRGRTHRV